MECRCNNDELALLRHYAGPNTIVHSDWFAKFANNRAWREKGTKREMGGEKEIKIEEGTEK